MITTHVAWLGLGSNLDDPRRQVLTAIEDLAALPHARVLAVSPLYRTVPVGGPANQPQYCNACVALACAQSPLVLLDALQRMELAHGRVRDVRWGPRTLDIDMLAYDDVRMTHARLRLPHPRAAQRAFVLAPLADIAPALVLDGGRVLDHLHALDDDSIALWPQVA